MGFCAEFGPQLTEGCDHLMVAGTDSCSCPECGVVCQGQFDGCSDVWIPAPSVRVRETVPADMPPAARVADPAPTSSGQDELLRILNGSLAELTTEFRSVAVTVHEQGEQTRALLEAQTDATNMLLDAIRMLPRQLEAAAEARALGEAEDESMVEPVELLRPEVVRFDHGPDDAAQGEPWQATRSRWNQG